MRASIDRHTYHHRCLSIHFILLQRNGKLLDKTILSLWIGNIRVTFHSSRPIVVNMGGHVLLSNLNFMYMIDVSKNVALYQDVG